jgi:hypothetical protein
MVVSFQNKIPELGNLGLQFFFCQSAAIRVENTLAGLTGT